MPAKFEQSKNWFWIILDVALVVVVIFGLSSVKYLWAQSKATLPARTISVSAEGKVVVAPDVATLSFSVVAEGPDPEKLQNDNVGKITNAVNFLKEQGVEAQDIKTAGYNLNPKYVYDDKTRKSYISGYTLTQTVFVKIRELTKVGKILSGLPSKGINDISGLSFAIDDPDKFLNEARKEAFEKAMAKAKEMASYNGVKIRRVVSFNEYGGGYPIPLYAKAEVGGFGGDLGRPVPAPTIEPGSQEVTVSVNVTYEIW